MTNSVCSMLFKTPIVYLKKLPAVHLVLCLILLLSLSSCGQSGPLYLPDQVPKNQRIGK